MGDPGRGRRQQTERPDPEHQGWPGCVRTRLPPCRLGIEHEQRSPVRPVRRADQGCKIAGSPSVIVGDWPKESRCATVKTVAMSNEGGSRDPVREACLGHSPLSRRRPRSEPGKPAHLGEHPRGIGKVRMPEGVDHAVQAVDHLTLDPTRGQMRRGQRDRGHGNPLDGNQVESKSGYVATIALVRWHPTPSRAFTGVHSPAGSRTIKRSLRTGNGHSPSRVVDEARRFTPTIRAWRRSDPQGRGSR